MVAELFIKTRLVIKIFENNLSAIVIFPAGRLTTVIKKRNAVEKAI